MGDEECLNFFTEPDNIVSWFEYDNCDEINAPELGNDNFRLILILSVFNNTYIPSRQHHISMLEALLLAVATIQMEVTQTVRVRVIEFE
jgi:hypothetical protein